MLYIYPDWSLKQHVEHEGGTMAEKSEFFSNFIEIEKRPFFSLEHEINPDDFKELVGEYRLDEDVVCQVKGDKGICHQKHKNGWLGVTKDGFEVLIGGDCARTYFKADRVFAYERKRVRKELDREKALHKLNEYRKNVLIFTSEISSLRKDIIDARIKFDQVHKLFPEVILTFIDNAQKTRNWDINVDVLQGYRDDENGTQKWAVSSLGRLKTLPNKYELYGLIRRLKYISETFEQACQVNVEDLKTPKLKKIVEALNEKEEIEKKTRDLINDVSMFVDTKNLEPLIYLCDNDEDEFITTKSIMILTNSKVSTEGHIRLRLRRIKERIERQFDGKLVRKNQLIEKFQRRNAFTV